MPHQVNSPQDGPPSVSILRLAVAFALVSAWVLLFGGGIVVGTQPYIDELNPSSTHRQHVTVEQFLDFTNLTKGKDSDSVLSADQFVQMSRADADVVIKSLKEKAASSSDVSAKQTRGTPASRSTETSQGTTPTWTRKFEELTFATQAHHWFYFLTCYTVTNVGWLSCIASILGGMYRTATFDASTPKVETDNWQSIPESRRLLAGGIQGFVIYLALIAGLLLIGEQPFVDTTRDMYIRLAGLVSVLSFWAGYSPGQFASSMMKLLPFPPNSEPAPNDAANGQSNGLENAAS